MAGTRGVKRRLKSYTHSGIVIFFVSCRIISHCLTYFAGEMEKPAMSLQNLYRKHLQKAVSPRCFDPAHNPENILY
jgi:hypothetical protein